MISYPALIEKPVVGGCTVGAATPAAEGGLTEEARGGKVEECTSGKLELLGKGNASVEEGVNWEGTELAVVKELLGGGKESMDGGGLEIETAQLVIELVPGREG